MNKTFETLSKVMPFLSVLFLLIGFMMAILSALDHNVHTFIVSLVLISQSVLALTYTMLFKKIWNT